MGNEPDLQLPPLSPGRFLGRLSRFHAEVEIEGERVLAHLPNSGRLRELLLPGARVMLARAERETRLTPFDVVLVEVAEEERERGRGGERVWACVDARLPPRIVEAALARGALPSLSGFRVVAREPPLEGGRADLLVRDPNGVELLVECKSVTLVRAGAGLFPDSPTFRGTFHVRSLAGRGGVVVLVVQREDARSVRANEPADPAFARVLREAVERGVLVLGVGVRVGPEGLRVEGELPVEWFRAGVPVEPLPDHFKPGLRLLFVGLNPGTYSAWYGMYFARPENLFWRAARASGIVPASTGPGEEAWLAREFGIGFTDVVKRPSRSWSEITGEEIREGVRSLAEKVRALQPRALCFVGLAGARAALGARVGPGPAPRPFEGARVFVLPSTSPRQGSYSPRRVLGFFRQLASWLRES